MHTWVCRESPADVNFSLHDVEDAGREAGFLEAARERKDGKHMC